MNPDLEFAQKAVAAYASACRPLCQQLKLPQTAFDILLFLANNPDYRTARDIVEVRHIKANLVSVNVSRLVEEGYLLRQGVPGDRRKTELVCTPKAQPIIRQGQQLQRDFRARLLSGTDEATRQAFFRALEIIGQNLDAMLEETV